MLFRTDLWTGAVVSHDGVQEEAHFLLSLIPDASYPVLGVYFRKGGTQADMAVVTGTLNRDSTMLTCTIRHQRRPHTMMEAVLHGEMLVGTLDGQRLGLVQETDGIAVCGLCSGSAVPSESLAPFLIPTNPIRWTFAIVEGLAVGCAILTDTADIPDQPVLFSTLFGTSSPTESGTGTEVDFEVTKRYEPHPTTDGIAVTYRGRLQGGDADVARLVGTWDNPFGGSHGTFDVRVDQRAPARGVACIVQCERCRLKMRPGDVVWVCEERKATGMHQYQVAGDAGKQPPGTPIPGMRLGKEGKRRHNRGVREWLQQRVGPAVERASGRQFPVGTTGCRVVGDGRHG